MHEEPVGLYAPSSRKFAPIAARKAARGTRPMSSQPVTATPAGRAKSAIRRVTMANGTRSKSVMFIDTWTRPGPRLIPRARRLCRPPSRSRTAWAIRRARPTSSLPNSTLKATSGIRAPIATAPPFSCRATSPISGRCAGSSARPAKPSYSPRRTSASKRRYGFLHARAGKRHDRQHVERADAGMRTAVAPQINFLQCHAR